MCIYMCACLCQPVHFGDTAALSAQYDPAASAATDYADSMYLGDLTIIAVS